MLGTQNFHYLNSYQPVFASPAPLISSSPQPLLNNTPPFGLNNTLTHIPTPLSTSNQSTNSRDCKPIHRKRGSFEMEDEEHFGTEPPAKQLLSESKLFKQFGSLQIDPSQTQAYSHANNADSIDNIDSEKALTLASTAADSRNEFKRYVYLLYMERNRNNPQIASTNPDLSFDNLLRDEREKLSKAVVLWNPSMQPGISRDSDSDDDFTYSDHTDFLRYNTNNSETGYNSNNSVVITEVTEDDFEMADEDSLQPNTAMPSYCEPDDVMDL